MKLKINPNLITKTSESRLHKSTLPIIGLTGGIASGKSSVSSLLIEQGFQIICADKLVKEIYNEQASKSFIKNNFNQAFNQNLVESNCIDFKKLREIAFSNPKKLSMLENFLYKKMPQKFKQKISFIENSNGQDFIIYDIPLLFEKNLQDNFDQIILVYTDFKNQIERTIARDKCTKDVALKIINSQEKLEKKKNLSNFIINNNFSFKQLQQDIISIMQNIIITA